MEENDSGIIHTLYSSDFIYSDYHQPFRYQCKVRYYHGEWQLVYPLNWVERREIVNGKCNTKATPGSYKFKKKQIVQELSDLLNCDFNSKIQHIKMCISDYRNIIDSANISQENAIKETEDLLTRFEIEIGSLHPYFYQSAADFLRDELIADFYNRYNAEIAETDSDYRVTAEYLNCCVNDIMKSIDPLLIVATLRKSCEADVQFTKEIFKDKLKKFLLEKILSCHRTKEMLLASPLQDISDSLCFLAQSCEFLYKYKNELRSFTSDEKLEICILLFSQNSLEDNYRSFCQEWNRLYVSFGENLRDSFYEMRICLQSDKTTDFHRLLSDNVKLSSPVDRKFTMQNFSSVVFLALKEMIADGDADENTNSKSARNSTYIIRCENCGRYFVPPRSNVIYCSRQAPDSDKTCLEIGAKKKNKRNRSLATSEYETIRKRIDRRISYADNSRNSKRVSTLKAGLSKWNELEIDYRKQLDSQAISEEEYIKKISDAFNSIFA